jgi:N-acetylglucosaminyl-diphospho-decaprenol L-rhamnosyltransferase
VVRRPEKPLPSPFISVVTVLYNSGDVAGAMASSIPRTVELVVVDNASSDGGADAARSMRADAVIVALPTNGGFGHGCNAGARAASGDVLVFLNPDCRPDPGALEILAERASREPSAIFGPALLTPAGRLRYNARKRSVPGHDALEWLPFAARWVPRAWRRDLPPGDPRYVRGGEVDYLQGACLAITRRRFLALGGFDEDYFLYSEEEALCEAVRRAGGECVYVAEAQVRHAGAASTGKVTRRAARHAARSQAILYRKRYGEAGGLAAIAMIASVVLLNLAGWPLARAVGLGQTRTPAVHLDTLVGLAEGATFRSRALARSPR